MVPPSVNANRLLRGRRCRRSGRCRSATVRRPSPAGSPGARAASVCSRKGLAVSGQTATTGPGASPRAPLLGQRQVCRKMLHSEGPAPISGPAACCPAPARPSAGRWRRHWLVQARQAEAPPRPPAPRRRRRQRQPRAGRRGQQHVGRVRPCTPTQAAGWMNTSPRFRGSPRRCPRGSTGTPVSTNCRARSASTQAPANASTRGQPGRARRATAHAAGDEQPPAPPPSPAPRAAPATRSARPRTRIASVIQYRPSRWWPKPNHQPRRAAHRGPGARRRSAQAGRAPRPAAPGWRAPAAARQRTARPDPVRRSRHAGRASRRVATKNGKSCVPATRDFGT